MNVTWTGKQEYFHPKQKEQLDSKLGKLAKLLDVDGKGDKQTRVVLTADKNVHRAEIHINYLDHTLVGEHVDPDQFTALNLAIERLERQMMKVRDRRRDVKKGPREGWDKGASANTVNEAEPRDPELWMRLPRKRKAEGLPRRAGGRKASYRRRSDARMIDDDPYLVFRTTGPMGWPSCCAGPTATSILLSVDGRD